MKKVKRRPANNIVHLAQYVRDGLIVFHPDYKKFPTGWPARRIEACNKIIRIATKIDARTGRDEKSKPLTAGRGKK